MKNKDKEWSLTNQEENLVINGERAKEIFKSARKKLDSASKGIRLAEQKSGQIMGGRKFSVALARIMLDWKDKCTCIKLKQRESSGVQTVNYLDHIARK